MTLSVVGTGYVGLVSGTCFAEMGNTVWCIDSNEEKISVLKKGEVPFYEPGLEEMVMRNSAEKRLFFTSCPEEAIAQSDIVFIAVGTPSNEDGSADIHYVLEAARAIATQLSGYTVIVNKSTVPVGTAGRVRKIIKKEIKRIGSKARFDIVSNPEFLKEGDAINDFMYPDRVVIGCVGNKARKMMKNLYEPFARNNHPVLFMDIESAEISKYAANAMLASRISFMNEIASLCERTGGNITQVRAAIGSDARIGLPFLYAGTGYGGSCFPKDVRELIASGTKNGLSMPLVRAIHEVNEKQKYILVQRIIALYGEDLRAKTFAIWGLAFKPQTDDMRDAPSLVIIKELSDRGARIRAYEPEAIDQARLYLKGNDAVEFIHDQYDVLEGCDGLILVTEWKQFRQPDFLRMKDLLAQPFILDGRNQYKPKKMRKLGFSYHCIGRQDEGEYQPDPPLLPALAR